MSSSGKDKPASPFAALSALRDKLPEGPKNEPQPQPVVAPVKPTKELAEKLVVSRSTKGRGGKTVTTIAGVRDARAREALAQELRRGLGCGATVDGELVVVQGDQTIRLRALLEERTRKLIIGS